MTTSNDDATDRHSGARLKAANPESKNTGRCAWIPGSPLRGAPE